MGEIFFHELRRLWRDRTAALVVVLIFSAALFGAYNGARHVSAQAAALEQMPNEEAAGFSKMQTEAREIEAGKRPRPFFGGPLHAGMVGLFYPRTAVLPPAPFAFSSIGQTDVYPTYFKVTGERRESFMNGQEMENPTNLLIGRFDLAFVVIYLLPLFALALSYNLLSAERETGTLTLLRAQGVSLGRLLAGKLTARAFLLILPIVFATSLAAIAFDIAGEAWLKLAVFFAIVVLYIAFWQSLAALLNLYTGSSAANAVALALLWIVLVVLAPAFLHLTATTLRPVPSRLELIATSRELQTETREPLKYLEAYYAEYPDRRPVGKDLAQYDFPLYWAAIQREMERRTAPLLERYETALEAQQDFVKSFSILSPALAAQEALNDLAGTGFARHRAFVEQIKEFHPDHHAFFEIKTFRSEPLHSSDYDRMPRFEFRGEPPREALQRAGQQILLLSVLPALVVFLIWLKRKTSRLS